MVLTKIKIKTENLKEKTRKIIQGKSVFEKFSNFIFAKPFTLNTFTDPL